MSIFKHPASLENGTYRFDISPGQFVRAWPNFLADDQWHVLHVRSPGDTQRFAESDFSSKEVDNIVDLALAGAL